MMMMNKITIIIKVKKIIKNKNNDYVSSNNHYNIDNTNYN